ncbi:MAG: hypothetical protein KGL46_09970 [Hyphomicrobiales bacterium]|nr:hypothetical protein [Hyphomicrobiales bacterium]
MMDFLTRKARETLRAMQGDIDELHIAEDIRARAHLAARDLISLCDKAEASEQQRMQRRARHVATIKNAGDFQNPEVGVHANVVMLGRREAAFSDEGIAAVAERLAGAQSRP